LTVKTSVATFSIGFNFFSDISGREDTMLQVTKSAMKKIAEYFKDKPGKPVRIFLQEGGCAMPSLAMDVDDEIKNTDTVFNVDGYQFIVDEDFLIQAKRLRVDYTKSGFQFGCGIEFEDVCSFCESCG